MTFVKKGIVFVLLLLIPLTCIIIPLSALAFADDIVLNVYEVFYDNGQLKNQFTYYQHCMSGDDPCTNMEYPKHGVDTYWLEAGQKATESVYEHGVMISKIQWNFFYDDNAVALQQISSKTAYKIIDGIELKDGVSISWFENGAISVQKEYQEGVLIKYERYFKNGDIQTKEEYVNGVKTGEWVTTNIYHSGVDKYHIDTWQGEYVDGLKQGLWEMYYEHPANGISKYLQVRGSYLSDIKDGEWIEWYPNLEKKYQGSYNNGNKDSLWSWWDEDGKLYTEGTYKNGLKHGTWTWHRDEETFFSIDMYGKYGPSAFPIVDLFDGIIYYDLKYTTSKVQAEYSENLLDGECLMWFADDKKSAVGRFKKGLIRHGSWTAWNERGDKYVDAVFKNGVEVSRKYWKYYNEPFYHLDNYMEYAYGKAHGSYFSWQSTGRNSSKGSYSNGQKCGNWYSWVDDRDEDGNIIGGHWAGEWGSIEPTYYGSCGPVTPDMANLPDPEARTVKGRVTDATTGSPLSGAKIAVNDQQFISDNNGTYIIVLENITGVRTLTCTKNDYTTYHEKIDFSKTQHKIVNVGLKKTAKKPVITGISSKYGKIFIEGLSVENEYSVSVFWNNQDPGQVKFDKNGTAQLTEGTEDGGATTYNMGSDFNAALSTTANSLTISALVEDKESDSVMLNPIVIPVPEWSVPMGTFGDIEYGEGVASYSMEYSWPDPAFEMQINEKTLGSSLWTAWGLFPLIGGKKFGIIETQATVGLEANTLGDGSIKLAGQTGFTAAGQEIVGNIEGTGLLKYMSGKGLAWRGAEFLLGVNGTIKKEVGPISLIPALENAENWWLIGRPIKWFNNKAVIKGQIDAGAEVKLIMVINDNNELVFDKTEGQIMSGITLGLAVNICQGLSASLEGGATVTIYLVAPADPDYMKKIEATLFAKLQLVVLGYEKNWEATHTFPKSSESDSKRISRESLYTTGFKPVSRDFLNKGSYNQLVANTTKFKRSARSSNANSGELKIIDNIYPHSSPVIAEKDGKFMIPYVYSDPKDPVLQSMEIYYTYYDGSTYSTPMAIQDDTRSEFNPTVAYDGNGNVVAVWERIKDEDFSGELEEMVKKVEIVWSLFKDDTWSTPVAITDNQYMDHAPMLAESHDNKILLVWRSNQDNELIGTTEKPDTIHYATWNGSSFSEKAILAEHISDSFKFSLAYNGTNAILAYTKDVDGEFATPDEELYYHTFDGTLWTPAVALTTDSEWMDINPEVIYTRDGIAELVWLKQKNIPATGANEEGTVEGKLVRLTDWKSGSYETIREGCTSVSFTDFHIFAGSSQGNGQNQLAVIWQGIGDNNMVDLFYSTYDETNNVWSKDLRLTKDEMAEKSINGKFGTDGVLNLVFNKVTGDGSYTNRAVKNDLYYLTHSLDKDLALSADTMNVSPEPEPGGEVTLTVMVANKGDLAQRDVHVSFYEGDPNNGGQVIGIGTIPGLLKAGEQKEASVHWNVPEKADITEIFAIVDPEGIVMEADRNNNKSSFYPVQMNLVLLRCSAEFLPNGDIEVFSVVKNNGLFAAQGYTITYKADGKELITHAGYAIQPGKTAEILHIIIPDLEGVSNEPVIQVSIGPDNRVKEMEKSNISIQTCREMESRDTPDPGPVLNKPILRLDIKGNTVLLDWDEVSNAQGYVLFYAPADISYINSLDLGALAHLEVTLPPGTAFYVAVKAYAESDSSDYSNVVFIDMK